MASRIVREYLIEDWQFEVPTSFIDCVFLLLIFFMVTTIFARPVSLKVELPSAENPVGVTHKHVKLYVTRAGHLDLEGRELAPETLESALRQYVGQGEELRLTILVDRHTAHGHTLEAMEAAQKAGITRVYLATKSRPSVQRGEEEE